jgi:hypothetical protein
MPDVLLDTVAGPRSSGDGTPSMSTIVAGLVFTAATAAAVALRLGRAEGWWIAAAVLVAATAFALTAADEPRSTPHLGRLDSPDTRPFDSPVREAVSNPFPITPTKKEIAP